MKSDRIHFSVYVLYNVLYKDLFEVSEDPQMQNVCILLQRATIHLCCVLHSLFIFINLFFNKKHKRMFIETQGLWDVVVKELV